VDGCIAISGKGKLKQRDIFLFNDLMIIASHATKDRKVHGVIHLLNVTLENRTDKDEVKNAFDVLASNMFMYTFSFSNPEQKKVNYGSNH